MVQINDVLIVAIIFAAVYGVIKLLVRRKERLAMIEKGSQLPDLKEDGFSFSTLRFGIFFAGIGLGFLAGNALAVTTNLDGEVAYFSAVFFFGGLALIIAHLFDRKKPEK